MGLSWDGEVVFSLLLLNTQTPVANAIPMQAGLGCATQLSEQVRQNESFTSIFPLPLYELGPLDS